METVNNVAAAVSNAIWGEPKKEETNTTTTTSSASGQEPISGQLGNTKAGEPYDKGNEELTSEPKSLTKTSSRELTSSDSTADLPSTSNLPSTTTHSSPLANHGTSSAAYTIGTPLTDRETNPAAHTSPLAQHESTSISTSHTGAGIGSSTHDSHSNNPLSSTHNKKPESTTEITLPRDEKTDAATKAALDKLEKQAQNLSVSDTKDGAADTRGDGLVSAKKVGEGEGVNTGVTSTSTGGLQTAKEPASVVEPAHKSVTPAAATSSATHATPSSSTTSAPRKSESSGSSEEDVENGGRKKKLSLKEKIKAKLHKH